MVCHRSRRRHDRTDAPRTGIAKRLDEQYGDRMLKIVFIGQNMDKEQIIRDLDKCLE